MSLARFFVHGVLAIEPAVLVQFDAFAVIHLGLLGDVVTTLALGALERHFDALVGGHLVLLL